MTEHTGIILATSYISALHITMATWVMNEYSKKTEDPSAVSLNFSKSPNQRNG